MIKKRVVHSFSVCIAVLRTRQNMNIYEWYSFQWAWLMLIIIVTLSGAILDFLSKFSLHGELSPTCKLMWQLSPYNMWVMRNMSVGLCGVKGLLILMDWNCCSLKFLCWFKPITNKGREGTRVPSEKPWHDDQENAISCVHDASECEN